MLAAVFLLTLGARGADDAHIVLYQNNNVLTDRLGDDVAPFAQYIKTLQAEVTPLLRKDQPELLDVFVILKPGDTGPMQRSRVWLTSSRGDWPDAAKLKKSLEAVPPPATSEGPVVFAICYALNGAQPRSPKESDGKPPLPPEWLEKNSVKALPELNDAALKNIWPE